MNFFFTLFRINSTIHVCIQKHTFNRFAQHHFCKIPPPPFFLFGKRGRLNLFKCIPAHLTLKIQYLNTHQYMVDELACYSEKKPCTTRIITKFKDIYHTYSIINGRILKKYKLTWLKTICQYMYLRCTQMNLAELRFLSIYTWIISGRFLKWSVSSKRPVSRWIKRLDIEMIKATVARTIIPVIVIVIFGLVGGDVLLHIWLGFGCNSLLSKTIEIWNV